MKIKKYRYSDWLNGNVLLNTQHLLYKIGDNIPPIVSWDNFGEGEQLKIRNKQKEIFEGEVDTKLNLFTSDFDKRLEKSILKQGLIQEELKYLTSWFQGRFICNGEYYESTDRNYPNLITFSDYNVMMEYKEFVLKKATRNQYDFIHSPRTNFREPNKDYPQVIIYVVFKMIEHIARQKSNSENNEKKSNVVFEEMGEQKPKENLCVNLFTEEEKPIFHSELGYKLFLDLKEKIIPNGRILNNSTSEQTKYNLIWYTLLRTEPSVLRDIKQKTFLSYVKKRHQANLPENMMRFLQQYNLTNKEIANTTLKRFNESIVKKNMSTNNSEVELQKDLNMNQSQILSGYPNP